MPLRNLFIDFNSYFASVEQQLHPELRNKPVAVVPVLTDSTCCIAASYEAKKYGVRTGTIVSEAKRLCPALLTIEANHRIYIEYHHRLVETVESCLHVEQICSIDEMVCDLIGKEQKKEEAIHIAYKIKETIKKKVGVSLQCSIGIAPNRFLAKTASDMQKPNGLVIIEEKDLPECLFRLKLNDLCGIGRRMEPRLRAYGIDSVEKLCFADKNILRSVWGGIEGKRVYDQLRGEDVKRPPTHRYTVGHSHVLPPKLRNNESAFAVLHRLTQKAAMRLRHLRYAAGGMGISIKYIGKFKWHNDIGFAYTQNTLTFLNVLELMKRRNTSNDAKPLAVGITLFNLIKEENATLPLFENYERDRSLYIALDKLNRNYGYSAAYFGGSHEAINAAPMRVAFTQIPNLDIEDDQKKIF
jgi:DNA polymerase IV